MTRRRGCIGSMACPRCGPAASEILPCRRWPGAAPDSVIFRPVRMDSIRYGRPDATDDRVKPRPPASLCRRLHLQRLPGATRPSWASAACACRAASASASASRGPCSKPPLLLLDRPPAPSTPKASAWSRPPPEGRDEGPHHPVIAHRLATIQRADRIVVLDQAAWPMSGAMRTGGARRIYARLAAMQFGVSVD